MAVVLRSYQQAARRAITSRFAAGIYRQLLSAATGSGKTEIAASLIDDKINAGENCLFLAHRDRLVTQAAERISGYIGFGKVGLVNADRKDWWNPCVVATVQSACVEKQLLRAPKFNNIIIDECHRSNSQSYRKVVDSLLRSGGLLLGVTATPNRTDKKGLIPHVFQEVVFEIGMQQLIDEDYLSKVVGKEIKLPIDFSKIKTSVSTDGIRDYRPQDIKAAFEEVDWLERITEGWLAVASDRRTIIFVPPGIVDGRGCGMAHSLAEYMRLHGIKAAAVDGTTKQTEQDRVIADFTSGEIQVLVNVNIFTEGLDIPPIDCVLFARPTQSSIIYSQSVGRGTRKYPGKENCLVIDVTGINDQLAADGQSLMTLGKILPTEEQRQCVKAERIKAARQLIRKLWRKHITLRLDENEEIIIRGQIGAKDKKKLDELVEEVKEVLAERDAGSHDEEPAEEGGERRAVNTALLTGHELEIREIDFTRAAMKFDWDFDIANRTAILWHGEFLYQITRPDPDGEYLVESFLDRHGRLEPLREQGLWGQFATGKEARAFVERQIVANQLNKKRIFEDRTAPWRRKPITDKQRSRLEKMKIPIPPGCTSGQASDLLDEAFTERELSRGARRAR
jgi:superfamily II DNA or RNA helicase